MEKDWQYKQFSQLKESGASEQTLQQTEQESFFLRKL